MSSLKGYDIVKPYLQWLSFLQFQTVKSLNTMNKLNILGLLFFTTTLTFSQGNYDIYVSDAGNFDSPPWQILKYDQNGENGEVFISENLAWPQDILFLEDLNQVLISNLNSDAINIHDATTGEFIGVFATEADGPTRMAFGPDGLIYVLQWFGNGRVLRYETDGTYLGEFTNASVPRSIGLAWDSDGNLYVASYNQSTIRVFDTEGNDNGNFIESGLNGPTNIWFDESGNLLVNNYNAGQVLKFDSSGEFVDVLIAGISWNEGVAVLPNGDYLIGGGQNGVVNQYHPDGTLVQELISSQPLDLMTPNAVVLRNQTTFGTDDLQVADVVISPVPGDYFQLRSETDLEIDMIEVLDASGKRVYHKEQSGEVLWDGRDFPEGSYTISIQFKDGTSISQKVILQHK